MPRGPITRPGRPYTAAEKKRRSRADLAAGGRKEATLVIPILLQPEMREIAAAVCAIADDQAPALSAEAALIMEEVLRRRQQDRGAADA